MLTLILATALAQSTAEPAAVDDVLHALSYRHAKPCAELEGLTTTPVATLRHVVENVKNPPWVPMRAAECLQRNHAAEVRADMLRWVGEEELKGLGRQTISLVSVLPDDLAVEVAEHALAGPVADRARVVLAKDPRPRVAELTTRGVTP